ncbi:MAG TPA: FHA domain-containing protein [Thermoleophilaceae bacterium]|nr:FHA domain-containing protein [Thermoleophilaceae bacterium]
MQADPIAVALKFGFLAVLYLFLLWVAWSATRDVAGRRRPLTDDRGGGRDGDGPSGGRPRLVVVAAMGREPGTAFEIHDEAVMGRAETSDVQIEDAFASSAHARVFPRGQLMYIEDLGSTNGTYLNERQLERVEELRPDDTIRIGETEYRYQE